MSHLVLLFRLQGCSLASVCISRDAALLQLTLAASFLQKWEGGGKRRRTNSLPLLLRTIHKDHLTREGKSEIIGLAKGQAVASSFGYENTPPLPVLMMQLLQMFNRGKMANIFELPPME